MTSLDVCKMKVHEKIGVKVDQFLKIVWKISNLNKSRRRFTKYETFLPVVLNYMPYGLNV